MNNVDKFTSDILGQSSTTKQIKDAEKYAEDFRHDEMGGALYDWLVGAKQGIEEIGRSAANMGANVPADYLDEMALEKPELSPLAQAAAHRYDVAVQNFKNETVQPVALGAAMMGSSLGLAASVPFLINSTVEDAEANGVTQATKNLAYNLSPGTGFYDALLSGDADAKAYREAHPIRAMFMGIMGDADILAPAIHGAKFARREYLIRHEKKTIPEAEKIVNAEFLNTTPKKDVEKKNKVHHSKQPADNVTNLEQEILKAKESKEALFDSIETKETTDSFNLQNKEVDDVVTEGMSRLEKEYSFWDDTRDIHGKETPVAPSTFKHRVSITDIWRQANKFVNARPGHMTTRKKGVGGYFETRTKLVRSQGNQTFLILSHEIGHGLDDILGIEGADKELIGNAGSKWKNGEYSPRELRGEGIAEFTKEYTLNPAEARTNFPEYTAKFEAALAENPRLKKQFDTYCNMVRQWYNQSAEMRARGSIVMEGDVKTPFVEKATTVLDHLEEAFVDDTAGLRRIIKDFEKTIGKPIAFSDNPAEIALALKSYVPARIQMMLGMSKLPSDVVISALEKVWGVKLNKVTMADVYAPLERMAKEKSNADYLKAHGFKDWHEAFAAYAISLHSLEVIKVQNAKRVAAIEAELNKLYEAVKELEPLAENNIIIESRLSDILFYIEQKEKEKFNIEQGLDDYITPRSRKDSIEVVDNAPSEFKEVASLLSDYTENMLILGVHFGFIDKDVAKKCAQDYPHYVPFFRDNAITKGVETSSGNGSYSSGYVDIDNFFRTLSQKGSDKPVKDPLVSLHHSTMQLIEDGERNKVGQALVKLASLEEGSELMGKAGGGKSASDNIIEVWVNGKQQKWQVIAPGLYDALKFLQPQTSSMAIRMITKALSTPASMLRTGATQTPFFTIWNILRDIPTSVMFSQTGIKKGNIDVVQDAMTGFFKKSDKEMLAMFEAQGVPFATILREGSEISKSLRYKTNPNPSPASKVWESSKHIFEAFTQYNERAELYPRFQEFQRAMRQGYSAMEAGSMARDITTNFSRGGTLGRHVNKYIPFFNATVQGISKFFRMFHNHPAQTISFGIMYVTLPTLFLWQQNHDKEWYKDLPLKEKNRNWHFEVNGVVYRLPKPELMGYFFGTTIERMLDVIADDDDRSNVLSETSGFLRDSLLPPLSPPIVLQLVEWQTNYSFFRERNIVNTHDMKYLEPEEQYNIYTSEVAKGIGSATGTSPMLVDNSIKGITASMGITALGFMDMLLKENETPTKHWTGLSRFTYNKENANTRSSDIFYAAHSKYAKKKDKKSRAIFKALDSAKQEIDDIHSRINVIKNNPKLSGDRKSKEITALEKQINAIQRHANSKILGYKYIQGNK